MHFATRTEAPRKYAAISLKLLGADAKKAGPALRKLMETETDDVIRAQAEVARKANGRMTSLVRQVPHFTPNPSRK